LKNKDTGKTKMTLMNEGNCVISKKGKPVQTLSKGQKFYG
jgi:hypothetical protein